MTTKNSKTITLKSVVKIGVPTVLSIIGGLLLLLYGGLDAAVKTNTVDIKVLADKKVDKEDFRLVVGEIKGDVKDIKDMIWNQMSEKAKQDEKERAKPTR